MNDIRFDIPFRLPDLNDYVDACRAHWSKGAKFKKEIEDQILWVLPKKVKIECPVYLDFYWYEQERRRDKDNVAFAKKFILDAMQKKKMLPNDNNQYVLGFADHFVYGQGNKVKVVVRIGEEQ